MAARGLRDFDDEPTCVGAFSREDVERLMREADEAEVRTPRLAMESGIQAKGRIESEVVTVPKLPPLPEDLLADSDHAPFLLARHPTPRMVRAASTPPPPPSMFPPPPPPAAAIATPLPMASVAPAPISIVPPPPLDVTQPRRASRATLVTILIVCALSLVAPLALAIHRLL